MGPVAPEGERPPRRERGLHRVDVERGRRRRDADLRRALEHGAVRRVLARREDRRHRVARRLAQSLGAEDGGVQDAIFRAPVPRRPGHVRGLSSHHGGADADWKRGQHRAVDQRRLREGVGDAGGARGDVGVRRTQRRLSVRRLRGDRREARVLGSEHAAAAEHASARGGCQRAEMDPGDRVFVQLERGRRGASVGHARRDVHGDAPRPRRAGVGIRDVAGRRARRHRVRRPHLARV
mmetsp:Transcript_14431/g.51949  ORF Transcript_14431/g.51949 Transcript_14431/m.51949 type:complete len:237 (-) Transcript_14431:85-795(-)